MGMSIRVSLRCTGPVITTVTIIRDFVSRSETCRSEADQTCSFCCSPGFRVVRIADSTCIIIRCYYQTIAHIFDFDGKTVEFSSVIPFVEEIIDLTIITIIKDP